MVAVVAIELSYKASKRWRFEAKPDKRTVLLMSLINVSQHNNVSSTLVEACDSHAAASNPHMPS